MRRLIETAPCDGALVILEDDAGDNYGVARWSSEAERWLGENGEPIKFTPTHWYPTQGDNHLQQGLDFPFFLKRAVEQRATAGDVQASFPVPAGPVTGAEGGLLDLSQLRRYASEGRTILIEAGHASRRRGGDLQLSCWPQPLSPPRSQARISAPTSLTKWRGLERPLTPGRRSFSRNAIGAPRCRAN